MAVKQITREEQERNLLKLQKHIEDLRKKYGQSFFKTAKPDGFG